MHASRRTPAVGVTILIALAWLSENRAAAQTPVYTTLYNFMGDADGESPRGGVTLDPSGALYGTTYVGGDNPCVSTGQQYLCGTVFKLAPTANGTWIHTVVHNFSSADGSLPAANLLLGSDGLLYGTTLNGGAGINGGTVFRLTPPENTGQIWSETVLYSFPGGCTGQRSPYGPVSMGPAGALFGSAYASQCNQSGAAIGGAAFMLTPPPEPGAGWTEHTLADFYEPSEGDLPYAGLVAMGGSWYGTTSANGAPGLGTGCGSVYQLSPPAVAGGTWITKTIHSFTGPDGCNSEAALTVGPGGVLYGTTYFGGTGTICWEPNGGCGTVFQLTPPVDPEGSWTETVLHSFQAFDGFDADGAYPSGSVVLGKGGVLYGTTQYGGSNNGGFVCIYYGAENCGTVFQLTPPIIPGGAWKETILYNFGNASVPIAGLTLSPSGVLYGTTSGGGTEDKGTVFSVVP